MATHVFKFRYRGAAGTGGLAANLWAESAPIRCGIPSHSVQIHKKIWLGLPASGLHGKDAAWLAFGVSINAPALSELLPDGDDLDARFPGLLDAVLASSTDLG
ncbi:hypothetical protein [Streptomyces sp. NPDC048445]|uniref:hypothetical protein n=1 Tax=Streptomyces sp. NPDC048445 TaxID=3365553 RepID=UPI0037111E09